MSDDAAPVPPLLVYLAEGFSMPLIGLFALIGIVWGVVSHNMEASSPQPKEIVEPEPTAEPTAGPVDPRPEPSTPADPADLGPASAAAAEEALDAGQFDRALAIAKRAKATNMAERARLFTALTRTIKAGPLARAKLTRVVADGRTVIGVVGGSDPVVVEQVDGKEVSLAAADVTQREPLTGEARTQALRSELQRARDALGDKAGGLTLHRLSYLAYSTGLRDLGTKFLKEALIGKEGSILVDMFGGSDFARLHRARREMAGEPVDAEPIPIAQVPDDPEPEAPVAPRPRDPDPVEPKKDPAGWRVKRTPGTKGPVQADPLLNDPQWKDADEAYRSGLRLYRGTFGKSNRAATASMKAAMKEFRRAQDLLSRLANRYSDNYTLERREQEVGKIILDCMKRSGLR